MKKMYIILLFMGCSFHPQNRPDNDVFAKLDYIQKTQPTIESITISLDSLLENKIFVRNYNDLDELIESIERALKVDSLIKKHADSTMQPKLAVISNEFTFQQLVHSQKRLEDTFNTNHDSTFAESHYDPETNMIYHFDNKVSQTLPFIQANRKYSSLKTNALLQTLTSINKMDTSEERSRAWKAVDRMVKNIDLKKSEYDYDAFNRSAHGLYLSNKNLLTLVQSQLEAEKDSLVLSFAKPIAKYILQESQSKINDDFDKEYQMSRALKEKSMQSIKNSKTNKNNGSATYWFNKGFASKDFAEQIIFYTKSIQLDSLHAKSYNNRGIAFYQTDDLANAERDFLKAVTLDSTLGSSYYHLGIILQQKGAHIKAIHNFKQSTRLLPEFAYNYFSRGQSYKEIGDYQNALKDYTRAIMLQPENSIIYNNRANLYKEIGEYKKALHDYTTAINLDTEFTNAIYNRANLARKMGNDKQAIKDYTTVINRNPTDFQAIDFRGVSYKNLKQTHKAIADHKKAIEINSQSATAYYNLGAAYWELEDWLRVIWAWEKCLELEPDHKLANKWLPRAKGLKKKGWYLHRD